jgi:SAM-dependent methyltransferase
VLDCACGTGTLAVGLAPAGFVVAASDASPAMVERTRALAAERGVDDGGLLAVTSRNWERPQEAAEDVVERGGRRARVRHAWHAGEPPVLEVAVTFDDGTTHSERLEHWPFTHGRRCPRRRPRPRPSGGRAPGPRTPSDLEDADLVGL